MIRMRDHRGRCAGRTALHSRRYLTVLLSIAVSAGVQSEVAAAQSAKPASALSNAVNGGASTPVAGASMGEFTEQPIREGDTVHISVFGAPDFSMVARVSESGDVPYPYLGSIHLIGMNSQSAAALIADKLRQQQLVVDPHVLVTVDGVSNSITVLGEVRLCTERFGLALRRLRAERFTAARCALIGDAAHVVHPLAGQGVNLGLLDAAALIECVLRAHHAGEDPGAAGPLRRYERWRKSELAPMTFAIDSFNRFLAHDTGPLAHLAQHGLAWVNRSETLKGLFIDQALGLAGELPAAARVPPASLS